MVAFVNRTNGLVVCGGSLVAKDIVLTAAHCAASIEDANAVIGRHDLSMFDGEEIEVDQVVVHPEYNATAAFAANDYALAMLSQPTSLVTEFAQLNSNAFLPATGDVARVMGWGDVWQDSEIIALPEELMETDLSIISKN